MIMKLVGVCRSLAKCLSMFIYTLCLPGAPALQWLRRSCEYPYVVLALSKIDNELLCQNFNNVNWQRHQPFGC